MDQVFQIIFSWQLLILALGIAGIIQMLTILLTYLEVKWLDSKFWNMLCLPLLPLLLGAGSGLLNMPMPFSQSLATEGRTNNFTATNVGVCSNPYGGDADFTLVSFQCATNL